MSLSWGGRRFRPVAPITRVDRTKVGNQRQRGVYLTGSFIQPNQQEDITPPVETFYLLTAQGDILQTAQGENILWYIEPAPSPTPTPSATITPTPTITPSPTPTPTPTPIPFDPDSISGLTYLWDSSYGVVESGGYVTTWTDTKSSKVATAVSSTTFTKSNSLNGLLGITNNPSATSSMTFSNSNHNEYTIFAVAQSGSTNDPQYVIGGGTFAGLGLQISGDGPFIFANSGSIFYQGGVDLTTPQYVCWQKDSTNAQVRQNGSSVYTNVGWTENQSFNRIFENTSAGFRAMGGTIWEILFYNRYLNATEISQVETYIQDKYGL